MRATVQVMQPFHESDPRLLRSFRNLLGSQVGHSGRQTSFRLFLQSRLELVDAHLAGRHGRHGQLEGLPRWFGARAFLGRFLNTVYSLDIGRFSGRF